MNIIKTSRELNKKELYKLTKAPNSCSMTDAVGMTLKVDCWILYQDTNNKGETVEILAIMDGEGKVYTTISETFKRSFLEDICEIFDDPAEFPEIEIIEGTTKNGRTYINCAAI